MRLCWRRYMLMLVLGVAATPLRADMWECTEANGTKRFTNIKSEAKGCKPLAISEPNVVSVPKSAGKSPDSFPKVDAKTQTQRDNDRRKILENEMASEQKLLDAAKKDLAEQESIRTGGERNYQRVLDRLEPYQKKVKLHEDNVANLQKELNNLR